MGLLMDTRLGDIARAAELITDERVWFAAVTQSVLDEVARLITEDQLASGIDGKGNQLGEYAPLSVVLRREMGLQTDFIDLNFTREFYDSITANLVREGIDVDGDGQKPDQDLFVSFGEDIITLTDENLQYIIEEVREGYIAYVLQALGVDS